VIFMDKYCNNATFIIFTYSVLVLSFLGFRTVKRDPIITIDVDQGGGRVIGVMALPQIIKIMYFAFIEKII